MFTIKEIQAILQLINQLHIVFIGQHLGTEILTGEDRKVLANAGIDLAKLPVKTVVENAFSFGLLSATLKQRKRSLTFQQFLNFVTSDNFVPFSPLELEMINQAKISMYHDIKGLGNRINQDFSRIAIEGNPAQRAHYENILAEETEKVVKNRQSILKLASNIGHKTQDWSRDLDRIADYQLHRIYNQGKVAMMMKSGKPLPEIKVWFRVYDSACKECVEAYLTDGVGSAPKIFSLAEILDNGTNVGRKQKDWLPVISPMHPWCRCEIEIVEENTVWDKKLHKFVLRRNTYNVKRKSKVHITLNGKEV
jgi:hypothetical protein